MKRARRNAAATAVLGSINDALRCINGPGSISDGRAHEARKQLRRARAALRLLRPKLSNTVYRRENRALRDASRAVSRLRDAKAQIDIVIRLREHYR